MNIERNDNSLSGSGWDLLVQKISNQQIAKPCEGALPQSGSPRISLKDSCSYLVIRKQSSSAETWG